MRYAIAICGRAGLAARMNHFRPTDVVSILNPGEIPVALPRISPNNRLFLTFQDTETLGHACAARGHHFGSLIEFAQTLEPDSRLLIESREGLKRAPAVALALIIRNLGPHRVEDAIRFLECLAPGAQPSAPFLQIAQWSLRLEEDLPRLFGSQLSSGTHGPATPHARTSNRSVTPDRARASAAPC